VEVHDIVNIGKAVKKLPLVFWFLIAIGSTALVTAATTIFIVSNMTTVQVSGHVKIITVAPEGVSYALWIEEIDPYYPISPNYSEPFTAVDFGEINRGEIGELYYFWVENNGTSTFTFKCLSCDLDSSVGGVGGQTQKTIDPGEVVTYGIYFTANAEATSGEYDFTITFQIIPG